jgi:DNA-binding transcriptional ArsR family regulator
MRTDGQKLIWKENEKKIKQTLAKKNLTFTELIEKTGLSRAVVNKHLKELVKTEKVVKRLENDKIVNILTDDARRELGPQYIGSFAKEISLFLKKADTNFQETLNPEGFFYYMNSYLDLMMLKIIPIIRETEQLKNKEKKISIEKFQELTENIITLYISDIAKAFAEDFIAIVLEYGKELDVELLMKGLKGRIKNQSEIT